MFYNYNLSFAMGVNVSEFVFIRKNFMTMFNFFNAF